jgi:uncharacterized protein (TIGR02001 family)
MHRLRAVRFKNKPIERMTMRKSILAAAVAAAFVSPVAVTTANAQAAAAPASPHTFTGNVSVASEYRFRGISQSYKLPALQGGFDYSHASGFYVGNWNSSVSGNTYNNGAALEMDFYGGWKTEFSNGIGLDIGGLYYYYPGSYYQSGFAANGKKKYDNFELYLGLSYKWLSAKYSYATTDYFGLNGSALGNAVYQAVDSSNTAIAGATAGTTTSNSKGSQYFELNANYEIAPKWTLVGHVGHVTVKNYSALSYTDYKIGVTFDAGFATLGAALVGTDAKKDYYRAFENNGFATNGKQVSGDTLVLTISKTF